MGHPPRGRDSPRAVERPQWYHPLAWHYQEDNEKRGPPAWHIQQAALEMRVPALTMASGAGHDAQSIARLCPMGMIFVPSRDGISHSPEEFSRPEDIACGAELLYRTLLRLDQSR